MSGVLVVRPSSLGDVVWALAIAHDVAQARPGMPVDWVVEEPFAALPAMCAGVRRAVPVALRRWRRHAFASATWREVRSFRDDLRRERYDAVLDLQGLTKSALIARSARGVRYGLANRTEGASHEWPARWLANRPIRIEPHIHALDRSRELVARALGYRVSGPPDFGLAGVTPDSPMQGERATATGDSPTLAFLHGSSREDKLWPEDDWLALGRRAIGEGWRIALPRAGAVEGARAERLSDALAPAATALLGVHLSGVLGRA